jgi:transaldolase
VYALALEDLTEAAALFRPEWERTGGVDGYVSLEVPPDVAYDAAATVAFARRLHGQAGFPNLLVKIPGTPQGLTAMEEAVTAGIGVNVTLLFSDTHYLRTADAYLRALERRRRAGLDLPDTYYLGRLAAPDTIDTVPEQTLLAFADHGSLEDRLEPDYAAAERAVAAAADAGIDADALAERLQRHGAGAFTADWAALLTAIKEKAAKLTQHARGKIDEGSS